MVQSMEFPRKEQECKNCISSPSKQLENQGRETNRYLYIHVLQDANDTIRT